MVSSMECGVGQEGPRILISPAEVTRDGGAHLFATIGKCQWALVIFGIGDFIFRIPCCQNGIQLLNQLGGKLGSAMVTDDGMINE